MTDFKSSQTAINLMRAFAGESQARNRYLFAAAEADKQKLPVIAAVFRMTADQELAHAKVFYDHLQQLAGETVHIDGGYPVDSGQSIVSLLMAAQHNEYEENDPVYPSFAACAKEEGFLPVYHSFTAIAAIERTHGDRFGRFAKLMQEDKLFSEGKSITWMCLNCGHIHVGAAVPEQCPVCHHAQGYFVRQDMAPYTKIG